MIHSPSKPVLIFVSSRRQTRLTALDLIAYLATDSNPKQWLHLPEEEMENIISGESLTDDVYWEMGRVEMWGKDRLWDWTDCGLSV